MLAQLLDTNSLTTCCVAPPIYLSQQLVLCSSGSNLCVLLQFICPNNLFSALQAQINVCSSNVSVPTTGSLILRLKSLSGQIFDCSSNVSAPTTCSLLLRLQSLLGQIFDCSSNVNVPNNLFSTLEVQILVRSVQQTPWIRGRSPLPLLDRMAANIQSTLSLYIYMYMYIYIHTVPWTWLLLFFHSLSHFGLAMDHCLATLSLSHSLSLTCLLHQASQEFQTESL